MEGKAPEEAGPDGVEHHAFTAEGLSPSMEQPDATMPLVAYGSDTGEDSDASGPVEWTGGMPRATGPRETDASVVERDKRTAADDGNAVGESEAEAVDMTAGAETVEPAQEPEIAESVTQQEPIASEARTLSEERETTGCPVQSEPRIDDQPTDAPAVDAYGEDENGLVGVAEESDGEASGTSNVAMVTEYDDEEGMAEGGEEAGAIDDAMVTEYDDDDDVGDVGEEAGVIDDVMVTEYDEEDDLAEEDEEAGAIDDAMVTEYGEGAGQAERRVVTMDDLEDLPSGPVISERGASSPISADGSVQPERDSPAAQAPPNQDSGLVHQTYAPHAEATATQQPAPTHQPLAAATSGYRAEAQQTTPAPAYAVHPLYGHAHPASWSSIHQRMYGNQGLGIQGHSEAPGFSAEPRLGIITRPEAPAMASTQPYMYAGAHPQQAAEARASHPIQPADSTHAGAPIVAATLHADPHPHGAAIPQAPAMSGIVEQQRDVQQLQPPTASASRPQSTEPPTTPGYISRTPTPSAEPLPADEKTDPEAGKENDADQEQRGPTDGLERLIQHRRTMQYLESLHTAVQLHYQAANRRPYVHYNRPYPAHLAAPLPDHLRQAPPPELHPGLRAHLAPHVRKKKKKKLADAGAGDGDTRATRRSLGSGDAAVEGESTLTDEMYYLGDYVIPSDVLSIRQGSPAFARVKELLQQRGHVDLDIQWIHSSSKDPSLAETMPAALVPLLNEEDMTDGSLQSLWEDSQDCVLKKTFPRDAHYPVRGSDLFNGAVFNLLRSGWITLSGTLRFGATAREINARCAIFLQNPALAYRGEAYLTKRRKGLEGARDKDLHLLLASMLSQPARPGLSVPQWEDAVTPNPFDTAPDGVSADSLYRSLAPPDDAPSQKGPEGLNVKLMGFQEQALYWLVGKELSVLPPDPGSFVHPLWRKLNLAPGSQVEFVYANVLVGTMTTEHFPAIPVAHGGCLADDSGLGKTVELLALILTNPAADGVEPGSRAEELLRSAPSGSKPTPVKATLVVTDPDSVAHWEDEARKHAPGLRTIVYSTTRGRDALPGTNDVAQADVVVADWGAVKEAVLKKGSAEAGTLLSVLWWRLIIDNPNGFGGHWSATKVGEAAAEIWRVNAWWVSSDPFLKGLKDLHGPLVLLDHDPFADLPCLNEALIRPFVRREPGAAGRLQSFLKTIMWRRTYEDVENQLEALPLDSRPPAPPAKNLRLLSRPESTGESFGTGMGMGMGMGARAARESAAESRGAVDNETPQTARKRGRPPKSATLQRQVDAHKNRRKRRRHDADEEEDNADEALPLEGTDIRKAELPMSPKTRHIVTHMDAKKYICKTKAGKWNALKAVFYPGSTQQTNIDGPHRDTLEEALRDRNYIIEFFARQRAGLIPNTRGYAFRMKTFLRSQEYYDMAKSKGITFTADMYQGPVNEGSDGEIDLE